MNEDLFSSTYKVSSPLIALYYTQIIGDARNPPTILAAPNFTGMAVIGMLTMQSEPPVYLTTVQMPIPIFPAAVERNTTVCLAYAYKN